jgi:membrane-bound lytic murein transglycosylase B
MNEKMKRMLMNFLDKHSYLRYIVASFVILLLSSMSISFSSYYHDSAEAKIAFFKPVIDKLIHSGADSAFVYSLVADVNTKFDEKFCKINVSGYLNKPDYSNFYNLASIKENRAFINANIEQLKAAELKYSVPKEVIASILWVETRHGKYLGKNNIVSVFLSTAMVDKPDFIEMNKKAVRDNSDISESEYSEYDKKIEQRTQKKADWAIKELLALEKMKNQRKIKITNIYGSWAGAFGISQFLPSSYMSWAIDGNSDGIIDLFNKDDAIFSVANYLKTNGWTNTDSNKRAAVFHYNNSNDYVDAVLKLAIKSEYTRLRKSLNEQMQDLDYIGE